MEGKLAGLRSKIAFARDTANRIAVGATFMVRLSLASLAVLGESTVDLGGQTDYSEASSDRGKNLNDWSRAERRRREEKKPSEIVKSPQIRSASTKVFLPRGRRPLMFHFSTKAICFASNFPNTALIDTKLTFL